MTQPSYNHAYHAIDGLHAGACACVSAGYVRLC